MRYLRYITLLLVLLIVSACGLDIVPSDSPKMDDFSISYAPADCSDAEQKKFIYEYMHDAYLWRDQVPELDYSSYSTQDELLEALKAPEDRFSAIYSKAFIEDYYEGKNIGLGFSSYYTSDSRIFIRYVIPGSPADLAGLKRGDRIISVNGYSAFDIINVSGVADVAFGDNTVGVQVVVDYMDGNDVEHNITVTKNTYYGNSVFDYNVFTDSSNGKAIGYLMYNSFNENTGDLDAALHEFEKYHVEEMVIDLRYNGGGLVSTAQYFGSIFAGNSLLGKILLYINFNSSYSRYDSVYRFNTTDFNLNIDKIVFLVSGETASASEVIMNGLKPFKNVYIIGDTTYGKNVGTTYVPFCDSYISAITFSNSNSLHYGDYSNGISPDCYQYEEENNMKEFGDPAEKLLSSAISYLETGNCVSEIKSVAKQKKFQLRNSLGIDHSLR